MRISPNAFGLRALPQVPGELPPNEVLADGFRALPGRTSKYNVGGVSGRYHVAGTRKIQTFPLRFHTHLYDGAGRDLGVISKPVMLNRGAVKRMDPDGDGKKDEYVWAWQTDVGSGWVKRSTLRAPPPTEFDPRANPSPPKLGAPLKIDSAEGRQKLLDLKFPNSHGQIPIHGNSGEHYAGRRPGPLDHVLLLFNAPNVKKGGVAKDSIPNGAKFLPGLDSKGEPLQEVVTMYRGGDRSQPVRVTFLYGRAEGSNTFGWIARANVGRR